MQEESKSFYKILQEKSPELTSQLNLIRKRGIEDWLPMIRFDRGSHGGYPHVRNVERNADKMIPEKIKEKFEAGEIFLLLSSIFLHDIGKVITDNFSGTACPAFSQRCECKQKEDAYLKEDPFCKNKRLLHIYYGEKIIRDSWGMLGLPDERIAEYCATIAYCHGISLPPNEDNEQYPCSKIDDIVGNYKNTLLEPYGKLRIPLLASILRLADETDNSWMRSTLPYWLKDIKEDSFSTLVKSFRRWIEDVEFCHEGRCIIMHIHESKSMSIEWLFREQESQSLNACRKSIQTVLRRWLAPLNDEGIYYDHVFFEYRNNLYNTSIIKKREPFKKLNFIEIFEDDYETKETVKRMVKAVVMLFLGSMDYDKFRWRSIEEFVGHPLTNYDRWLAEYLYAASSGKLKIEFMSGDDELIKVTLDKSKIKELYADFSIEEE